MTQLDTGIGFIGAGRMATALARGLITSGFAPAEHIVAADPFAAARAHFTHESGARTVDTNEAVLEQASIIVLAVKPQQMAAVLDALAEVFTERHLVASIAAGISIGSIAGRLGSERRIVRVMPNTPCLINAGASAYARGGAASEADAALVGRLLSTVGTAVEVPENLLDAVTGLSGSGPAYIYQVIEALSDGGVRVGLPREVATKLAAQTVVGAARMVLETGQHPGLLKDAVTSPGGTTIAGLHALERGGLRAALIDAVEAATVRSRELGASS